MEEMTSLLAMRRLSHFVFPTLPPLNEALKISPFFCTFRSASEEESMPR